MTASKFGMAAWTPFGPGILRCVIGGGGVCSTGAVVGCVALASGICACAAPAMSNVSANVCKELQKSIVFRLNIHFVRHTFLAGVARRPCKFIPAQLPDSLLFVNTAVTPAPRPVRYHVRMRLFRGRRALLDELEEKLQQRIARIPATVAAGMPGDRGHTHRIVVAAAWVAGGLGVVALGLMAGRELRGRYKFNRRTPYDYYAHSGDRTSSLDFGVGI